MGRGVREEVEHLASACRSLLERCDEPVRAVELRRPRCGDVVEQGVAGGGAEAHEQAGARVLRHLGADVHLTG